MTGYRVLGYARENGKAYFELYFTKLPSWPRIKRELRRLISKISYQMTLDDRDDYQHLGERRRELRCWLGVMPDRGDVVAEAIRPSTDEKKFTVRQIELL